jgi:sporulation protein Cse60
MTKNQVRVKILATHSFTHTEIHVNDFLAQLEEGQLVDIKTGRAGDMNSVMILYREGEK